MYLEVFWCSKNNGFKMSLDMVYFWFWWNWWGVDVGGDTYDIENFIVKKNVPDGLIIGQSLSFK